MKRITLEEANKINMPYGCTASSLMYGYNLAVERHNAKKKKKSKPSLLKSYGDTEIINQLSREIKSLRIEEENGYNDLNKRVDDNALKIESYHKNHVELVSDIQKCMLLEHTVNTNSTEVARMLTEINDLKETVRLQDKVIKELSENMEELNKKINEVRTPQQMIGRVRG